MAKARTGGGLSDRGSKEKIRDGGRREKESRRRAAVPGETARSSWLVHRSRRRCREREREASETKASSPPLSLRYSCTYTTPSPASEATRKRYAREKAARTRKWQTGSSWKECGSAKEKGGTRKKGAKQGDKHKGRTRNETKGQREEGKGLAGKERRGKGRGREGIGGKGQEGERKGKAGEKQQLRQRRTTGPQTWVALRRVHELGAVVVGDGGLDGAHRGGVVGNGTVSGEGTANHGSDAERLPQVAEHHRALPVAAQHRDGGRHSHGRQPCRTPDPQ